MSDNGERANCSRAFLVSQVGTELAKHPELNPEGALKIIDFILDESIPLERIERFCDSVLELFNVDALPWSPTGNPRCVMSVRSR